MSAKDQEKFFNPQNGRTHLFTNPGSSTNLLSLAISLLPLICEDKERSEIEEIKDEILYGLFQIYQPDNYFVMKIIRVHTIETIKRLSEGIEEAKKFKIPDYLDPFSAKELESIKKIFSGEIGPSLENATIDTFKPTDAYQLFRKILQLSDADFEEPSQFTDLFFKSLINFYISSEKINFLARQSNSENTTKIQKLESLSKQKYRDEGFGVPELIDLLVKSLQATTTTREESIDHLQMAHKMAKQKQDPNYNQGGYSPTDSWLTIKTTLHKFITTISKKSKSVTKEKTLEMIDNFMAVSCAWSTQDSAYTTQKNLFLKLKEAEARAAAAEARAAAAEARATAAEAKATAAEARATATAAEARATAAEAKESPTAVLNNYIINRKTRATTNSTLENYNRSHKFTIFGKFNAEQKVAAAEAFLNYLSGHSTDFNALKSHFKAMKDGSLAKFISIAIKAQSLEGDSAQTNNTQSPQAIIDQWIKTETTKALASETASSSSTLSSNT